MSALVSTAELAARLANPTLIVLNGSWHMPAEKRDAKAEHANAHIPGAQFFDIDAASDKTSPYPHMLPSASEFEKAASALGVTKDSEIIVYDAAGLFSAARVWWMFRVFGHEHIKVLDGGLPKWVAENRPVEAGEVSKPASQFKAVYHPELVRSFEQMEANITKPREQVVDARSAGRFNGTEPEPREGLKSGSIKGSVNIPFRECTVPPYHTLKPLDELEALFFGRGIELDQPITASCGSGVTACVLALALYELGAKKVAVYDGAWAEWGSKVT